MTVSFSATNGITTPLAYTEGGGWVDLFGDYAAAEGTISNSRITRLSIKLDTSRYVFTNDFLRYNPTGLLLSDYGLGGTFIQSVAYNRGTGTLDIYTRYPSRLSTLQMSNILNSVEYINTSPNPTANNITSKPYTLTVYSKNTTTINSDDPPVVVQGQINLTAVNQAPTILRKISPLININENQTFNYTIPSGIFSDVDSTIDLNLFYVSKTGASTTQLVKLDVNNTSNTPFTFDSGTGQIQSLDRFENNALGNYSFVYQATDGMASTSQSFTMRVNNINTAPYASSSPLTSLIISQTQSTGMVSVTIPSGILKDDDAIWGDTLSYQLVSNTNNSTSPLRTLPHFIQFNQRSNQIYIDPNNDRIGQYSLILRATDKGGLVYDQPFILSVQNTNDAPSVAINIPTTVMGQNTPLYLDLSVNKGYFRDIDLQYQTKTGDRLTYSVSSISYGKFSAFSNTPDLTWLHYNSDTGIMSGTPGNNEVGVYSFTLTATDSGGLSASQTVRITVNNVNDAPSVSGIANNYDDFQVPYVTRYFSEASTASTSAVAINIAPSLVITDSDDIIRPGINGSWKATVKILNAQPGDMMSFTNNTAFTSLITNDTSLLSFSGTGAANIASLQTLLRSVKFYNSRDDIGTAPRQFQIQVTDNSGASSDNLLYFNSTTTDANGNLQQYSYAVPNVVTIGVLAQNDAPTISGTANITATERINTQLLPNIRLTDIDSPSLAMVQISITDNFQTGDDNLVIVGTLPNYIHNIYNSTTGVLTISGPDSVANYQTYIRQVAYYNSNYDPAHNTYITDIALSRKFSVQLQDIDANGNSPLLSAISTANLTITPVDNRPYIIPGSATLFTVNKDNTSQLFVNSLSNYQLGIVNLDDNPRNIWINYSLTNAKITRPNGGGTAASAAFTLQELLDGQITYQVDHTSITDSSQVTFLYTASDTLAGHTRIETLNVKIRPQNYIPSFTGWQPGDNSGVIILTEKSAFAKTLGTNYFADGDGQSMAFTLEGISSFSVFRDFSNQNLSGLPTFLTYNSVTRSLFGTPGNEFVGSFVLRLRATDVVNTSGQQDFVISVVNVNDAPIFLNNQLGEVNYYTEKSSTKLKFAPSVTFNDVDMKLNDLSLFRFSATITGNPLAGDMLSTTNLPFSATPAGSEWNVTYNSSTFTLLITGNSNTSQNDVSSQTINTILNNLVYYNTNLNPTNRIRTIELKASDGIADSTATTVRVGNILVDDSPSWVSSPDFTSGVRVININENSSGTIFAFKASDPEGDNVLYSIIGDSARYFTIPASNGIGNLIFRSPGANYEKKLDDDEIGVYSLTIRASAKDFFIDTPIYVSVVDVDERPSFVDARIENEQIFSITENTSNAFLNLSAVDPEGDTIAYILSGRDANKFAFNSATGALAFVNNPNFESPASNDGTNSYIVQIRAESTNTQIGGSVTLHGTKNISVVIINEVEDPNFTSPSFGSINENTAGQVYQAVAEGDLNLSATYRLGVFGDSTYFSVNSSTGQVTILDTKLADYETKSTYNITITATANAVEYTKSVVISVGNLDEAPTFTSSRTISVVENLQSDTLAYGARAFDPDNDTITYTFIGGLSSTNNDNRFFILESNTGNLSFITPPNFEIPTDITSADNIYVVQLSATSRGANNTTQVDTITASVVVTNRIEAPLFTSPTLTSVAENAAISIPFYTATANGDKNLAVGFTLTPAAQDNSYFNINPTTGELKLNTPADFETKSLYSVQITGTANGRTTNQTVYVTIGDVNEAPQILSVDNVSVAENNRAPFYFINTFDPDAQDQVGVSYELGGAFAHLFDVNLAGQYIYAKNAGLNYEDAISNDNIYTLTLKASTGSGSRIQSVTKDIRVTLGNVDEAPVFLSLPASNTVSVNENVPTSTQIYTFTAQGESNGAVTFTLSDDTKENFTLVGGNILQFLQRPNYESKSTYTVQVTATTDGVDASLSSFYTLTVKINDLVEQMSFTTLGVSATLNENTSSTLLYDADITDPNNRASLVSYTLLGTDAQYFIINEQTGELYTRAPFNREASLSSDNSNIFNFSIVANNGINSVVQSYQFVNQNVNFEPNGFTKYTGELFATSPGASYSSDTTDSININENRPLSEILYLANFRNGASDNLGGFYALANGGDNQFFTINSKTGAIKAKANLDYENTVADFAYNLQVDYVDNINSGAYFSGSLSSNSINTMYVDLNLQNLIENVAISLPSITSIPEGRLNITKVSGSSDYGTVLSYTVVSGYEDGSLASINSMGDLVFLSNTDFQAPRDGDTNNTYIIKIRGFTINKTTPSDEKIISVSILTNSQALQYSNVPLHYSRPESDDNFVMYLSTTGDSSEFNAQYRLISTSSNASFTYNSLTGALNFVSVPDPDVASVGSLSNYWVQVEAFTGNSSISQNYTSTTFSFSLFNVSNGFYELTSRTGFLLADIGSGSSKFGTEILAIGDVNGDGFDDFAVLDAKNELDVIYGRANFSSAGTYISLHNASTSSLTPGISNGVGLLPSLTGFTSYTNLAGSMANINKLVNLGDINGDGYADFATTVAIASASTNNHIIMLGGKTIKTFTITSFSNTLPTLNANTIYGGGDINGDGYADFVVRVGYNSGATALSNNAYIVYGNSIFANGSNLNLNSSNKFVKVNLPTNSYFVNDLNGDHVTDLVMLQNSKTYIVYSDLVYNRIDKNLINFSSPDLYNSGVYIISNTSFTSVTNLGDFNGDGFNDIGLYNGGGLTVMLGKQYSGSRTASTVAPATWGGPEFTAVSATSITSIENAGDFNGDGYNDILIGMSSTYFSAGMAYLYFGHSSFTSVQNLTIDLNNFVSGVDGIAFYGQRGDGAGYRVSGGTDINGDGLSDIIVAAPNHYNPLGSNTGGVYVVYGQAIASQTTNANTWFGDVTNDTTTIVTNDARNRFFGYKDNNTDITTNISLRGLTVDGGSGSDFITFDHASNFGLVNFTYRPDGYNSITSIEKFVFQNNNSVIFLNAQNVAQFTKKRDANGNLTFDILGNGNGNQFIYYADAQPNNVGGGAWTFTNTTASQVINVSQWGGVIQDNIAGPGNLSSLTTGDSGVREMFGYDFNQPTFSYVVFSKVDRLQDFLRFTDTRANVDNPVDSFEELKDYISASSYTAATGQFIFEFMNHNKLEINLDNKTGTVATAPIDHLLLQFSGADHFYWG